MSTGHLLHDSYTLPGGLKKILADSKYRVEPIYDSYGLFYRKRRWWFDKEVGQYDFCHSAIVIKVQCDKLFDILSSALANASQTITWNGVTRTIPVTVMRD